MVKKKGKSKRTTLQQKYKIQRRVKEHHRRIKKEANRNAAKGIKVHKAKPKDPGIPNSWPFKADMLDQIARAREGLEKRKEQAQEARRQTRAELLAKRRGLIPDSLEAMLGDAQSRATQFLEAEETRAAAEDDGTGAAADGSSHSLGQQSRRAYMRELKKVVENSDVVLEVLDARDPTGSRSAAVEAAVAAHPTKRLVLVLNKVDLVPREVTAGWLAFLRRSHPAVAFKASTQERGIGHARGVSSKAEAVEEDALQRSGAVGVEALLGLLKNYSRSLNAKTSVTVGVVGYPNTGKSSLINSLKRSKAVGTSSTAGFTKSMQEVQLDKYTRLLDCPGIVFDDSDTASTVLRNCVNPDTLEDPEGAVGAVLQRCGPEQLMVLYALPRFDPGNADMFLGLLARKWGKVKKGGLPDKPSAARAVLRDWNSGKVPFFTEPPADTGHLVGDAAIVTSVAHEFDINNMMEADAQVLEAIPEQDRLEFVALQGSAAPPAADHDMEDEQEQEDEEMEEEDVEDMEDVEEEEEEARPAAPVTVGRSSRQKLKDQQKKKKKDARRAARDGSGGGGAISEDYDFGTDF